MFKTVIACLFAFVLLVGCADKPVNWQGIADNASVELANGCSGTLIGPHEILTAGHCTSDGKTKTFEVTVQGKTVTAYLKRWDKQADLAVIFVPGTTFKDWAKLAEHEVALTDRIFIFGNPRTILPDTITTGIVSFLKRVVEPADKWPWKEVNQYDANAAPGNSGGGVFNERGELVNVLVGGFFRGDYEFAGNYSLGVTLRLIKEFIK